MRKLKLAREREERFLKALSETGGVTTAVDVAGPSTRSRAQTPHSPALGHGRPPVGGCC